MNIKAESPVSSTTLF